MIIQVKNIQYDVTDEQHTEAIRLLIEIYGDDSNDVIGDDLLLELDDFINSLHIERVDDADDKD